MEYSKEVKFVDVRVGYETDKDGNQTGDSLTVLMYSFVNPDKKEKTDGDFTNKYGTGSEKLDDLVVVKKVSGNQADPTKEYSFTIRIFSGEGETNKEFIIVDSNLNAYKIENGKVTLTLKAEEALTVYGLSAVDKYIVEEADYGKEGYDTSFKIFGINGEAGTLITQSEDGVHTISTGNARTIDKEKSEESVRNTVVFTNHKNVSTPTGIVLTFAPYLLLVALAGIFAVLFLRRRRKEEF